MCCCSLTLMSWTAKEKPWIILEEKKTGVEISHVSVHGGYTKEQLEKMLTESRELTLMAAAPTIAARERGTPESQRVGAQTAGIQRWRGAYGQKYGSLHTVKLLCQGCTVNASLGGRAKAVSVTKQGHWMKMWNDRNLAGGSQGLWRVWFIMDATVPKSEPCAYNQCSRQSEFDFVFCRL